MASLIEKKENNVVVLTIDVSAEDFAAAMAQSFKKNAGKFNVPGFRKGKAPMSIVTKYYGEGVLFDDAINMAATPAYTAAVAEHGLEPVTRPEMDIIDVDKTSGLKFSITVTVKPEVKLGAYKGVEAVMPEFPVTDADVERELLRIQERNSRLVPVEDRGVEDGDTANIDYEGFLDGVPFEGGKGASYDLKIGSKTFIPGFEEKVIGHQVGEEFDVDVTFPEEYGSAELAGKAVVFKVRLNAVKIRELPVLDDEFAKDVSEFDTLAEYKESLRASQAEKNSNRAKGIFEENVVQAVVKNAEVDVPPVMVEQEVDRMVEEQRNQMRYQGIEFEQYLTYVNQTVDSFKEQLRVPAENRIKTQLVLEAVSKAEAVDATLEEIQAEGNRMAVQYGMKPEEFLERVGNVESGFIRDNVIHLKTIELLKNAAVPVAPPVEDIVVDPVPASDGDAE